MTNRFDPPRPIKIIDPNQEPVRIVDQATFHGPRGFLLDVTLCTMTPMPDGQTNFVVEAVVTARLRFDLGMAKALLEGIGKQVAMLEGMQPNQGSQARNGLRAAIN